MQPRFKGDRMSAPMARDQHARHLRARAATSATQRVAYIAMRVTTMGRCNRGLSQRARAS
eukprot:9488354-Pyramimonas_sp.AAC.1